MMDKIQDFILNHKKETIIAVCILILLLLLIIFILILQADAAKKAKIKMPDLLDVKIDPAGLWLLDEPLSLPPIQFSREQRRIWDEAEIEFWYTPPSKQIMEMLNKKNKNLVDNILEAAP